MKVVIISFFVVFGLMLTSIFLGVGLYNQEMERQERMQEYLSAAENDLFLAELEMQKIQFDLDRIERAWNKCEVDCNCECILTDDGLKPKEVRK